MILRLLKQGMTQRYCDPLLMKTHDLQELSKTYLHISRARTRLQHILLTHYLTLYFPEIERFWSAQRNEWLIRLLLSFPTPASIASVSLETFRDAIWKPMGRRVNKQAKVEEIYALASRSIALPVDGDSPAVSTFRLQLIRYLQLSEERTALEQQADALLSCNADYQRLRTVPGIGPVIALTILAEAGDLRRFGHHRQISEVLRVGPGQESVWRFPLARSALQARQRPTAVRTLDGGNECRSYARERLP